MYLSDSRVSISLGFMSSISDLSLLFKRFFPSPYYLNVKQEIECYPLVRSLNELLCSNKKVYKSKS